MKLRDGRPYRSILTATAGETACQFEVDPDFPELMSRLALRRAGSR